MSPQERAMLAEIGRCSAVGSLKTITGAMQNFIE
jgi:hypothetical protein